MYRLHLTLRTHTHFFSLRTPVVITRLAQGLDDLFVCVQKPFHHRSCHCWLFLRPRFLLFSHDLLPHRRHWLESDSTLCNSAQGWTVCSSGRFDPKHRLWAQVLHRCQWRAHADQPSEQKREFPAGVRRDDHRSRGPWFTSTFRSMKQQPAYGSKHSSHFVETWFIGELASRKRWRIVILLQVVLASRKLVRTWIVKHWFQVFSGLCQRWREIETKTLCKHWETGRISTTSLNGQLNWPCEEKNCLSKDYTKLSRMWRLSIGKNKVDMLITRSMRSSSPNDHSYTRRISVLIRLNERN